MNPLTKFTPGFEPFALAQPTPCIVYDVPKLRRTAHLLLDLCAPFEGQCFFSVKANRAPRILEILAGCGFGADIASRQELSAAVEAGHSQFVATSPGIDASTMAAVAKSGGMVFFDSYEQVTAARAVGVAVTEHGVRVSVGGPYQRFGFRLDELSDLRTKLAWCPSNFHFHFGEIESAQDLASLLRCADEVMQQFRTDLIDLGGGYAVLSNDWVTLKDAFCSISQFARKRNVSVAFEFGKIVTVRSAVLVTSVTARKTRDDEQILFVDASSYNLGTLERRSLLRAAGRRECQIPTTIAGPTCYEGDVFAVRIPAPIYDIGDKVLFGLCGAYATSVAAALHALPVPREAFFDKGGV